MDSTELVVAGDRPALLRQPGPGTEVRGGVVALPGASAPDRDQPLFRHLADTVVPLGTAVLSFDRRPADGDTPIAVQAQDAIEAASLLRTRLGRPVGFYGFSQGAWAATQAAADDPAAAHVVVVGCSGVSPAEQMRYYTDELLRRADHGDSARAANRALRRAFEDLLRGGGDRREAAVLLAAARDEPWFHLAYLPDDLPGPGDTWDDMDYDPEPVLARVTCPALTLYGADEECVPGPASAEAWRRSAAVSGNEQVLVAELPGCGHFPAPGADGSEPDLPPEAFSPAYTAALRDWFALHP